MSNPTNQPPAQGGVKLDPEIKETVTKDFLTRLIQGSAEISRSINRRVAPASSSAASASVPAPTGGPVSYPIAINRPIHESGSGGGKGNDDTHPSLDGSRRPAWWILLLLVALVFFASLVIRQIWESYKKSDQQPVSRPVEIAVMRPTPNVATDVAPQPAVSSEIIQKPLRSPYRTTFETAVMSQCDVVQGTLGNAQVFVKGLKAGPGCAWVEVNYPFDVFMIEGAGFTIEFPYQKDVLGVASCTDESCVRYLNHVRKSPDVKEKRVLIRVKKDTGNSGYPEGFVKIL